MDELDSFSCVEQIMGKLIINATINNVKSIFLNMKLSLQNLKHEPLHFFLKQLTKKLRTETYDIVVYVLSPTEGHCETGALSIQKFCRVGKFNQFDSRQFL